MLSNRADKDIHIDYVAKGSGAGIRDFQAKVVDFAASDAAMSDKEIAKVEEGVQLLPMTAGEVVLVYNLPGIKTLNLPREAYPKIFLGKIRKWNNPVIQKANPGIELPDIEITVVRRSDSSGTTFVFTKHLSSISDEFKNGPGYGKKITWPTHMKIEKAALNLGIAGSVKKTVGAIGYLDYGFANIANLDMAQIENKEGNFIAPGPEGGQAALANAKIPPNMVVWLTDPDGEKSYPITTFTWMLFYKKYSSPEKAEAVRKMINFCLDQGQKISVKFGYIPLPNEVVDMVRTASTNIR
jgi:phosphate transport system substrate-binding protein